MMFLIYFLSASIGSVLRALEKVDDINSHPQSSGLNFGGVLRKYLKLEWVRIIISVLMNIVFVMFLFEFTSLDDSDEDQIPGVAKSAFTWVRTFTITASAAFGYFALKIITKIRKRGDQIINKFGGGGDVNPM